MLVEIIRETIYDQDNFEYNNYNIYKTIILKLSSFCCAFISLIVSIFTFVDFDLVSQGKNSRAKDRA